MLKRHQVQPMASADFATFAAVTMKRSALSKKMYERVQPLYLYQIHRVVDAQHIHVDIKVRDNGMMCLLVKVDKPRDVAQCEHYSNEIIEFVNQFEAGNIVRDSLIQDASQCIPLQVHFKNVDV